MAPPFSSRTAQVTLLSSLPTTSAWNWSLPRQLSRENYGVTDRLTRRWDRMRLVSRSGFWAK